MSKLSILFSMGFVKQKNKGYINLKKSEDLILSMSTKDVKEMTDDEFIEFQNNIIDWTRKKVA